MKDAGKQRSASQQERRAFAHPQHRATAKLVIKRTQGHCWAQPRDMLCKGKAKLKLGQTLLHWSCSLLFTFGASTDITASAREHGTTNTSSNARAFLANPRSLCFPESRGKERLQRANCKGLHSSTQKLFKSKLPGEE